MSETKPERRRRDSSRGLGKDKRNKAKKQDISTLLFGAANGVSPLRGSQTSNGDAHFPTLRAGLTSDRASGAWRWIFVIGPFPTLAGWANFRRASGADLWQCAPSFVAKCMKLPNIPTTKPHPRRARQHSRNQEWESTGDDRCFHHQTAAPEAR